MLTISFSLPFVLKYDIRKDSFLWVLEGIVTSPFCHYMTIMTRLGPDLCWIFNEHDSDIWFFAYFKWYHIIYNNWLVVFVECGWFFNFSRKQPSYITLYSLQTRFNDFFKKIMVFLFNSILFLTIGEFVILATGLKFGGVLSEPAKAIHNFT